ncbi:hypothetical protein Asi02nite_28680 [Asanoa siamensis]|uniref:Uncharacterized protein n=2 Tax=Asanoa siamensis TaxID=926357 RepID=A0ABQ4CPX8_9ACTN|nr:hypothetical protein Asi02nite_28680 [Asanoa siamensis]
MSDEERRQAVDDARVEVWQLQWEAHRNFRSATANACMFFGLIAAFNVFSGGADVPAYLLMIVGGLLGAASYVVKDWRVVAIAVALVAGGIVWVLL